MTKLKTISILLLIVLLKINSFAQFGQMPPFSIQIEAIAGTNLPGVHSFAFAQSGDKWLIIGGRTNGLHGINSNDGFPAEYKNDKVLVIDTTTWQQYSADINQLSWPVADPMRSTNMAYLVDGNYLYMAGGFGYDSTLDMYVTFPTLTAVHIDNIINAVINALPISSSIRQVNDTNMAVCGGDLGKIGNDLYLCFGHKFTGTYADPPVPIFTQEYSNRIKKFNLSDNGTTMSLSGFTYLTDTTNFHRRDLNVGPVVNPDGSFSLCAYGGVFQKNANLPYRQPIAIKSTGTTLSSYQQVMSQYSCALLPIYDSAAQNMYTTFFGGISLYDYNVPPNTVTYDSLVPFINDVTTLTSHGNGTFEETILPAQLPGLLGANAKFILNTNLSHYGNEVINIRNLPNTKMLAGYLYGGIRAHQGNFGTSAANDTIYRIYITPNNTTIGIDELSEIQNVSLYPNPSTQNTSLYFNLKSNKKTTITLLDLTGKKILDIADGEMQKGNQQININTSKLSAGIYFCKIESGNEKKIVKVLVE
jgi:hypothetical protein